MSYHYAESILGELFFSIFFWFRVRIARRYWFLVTQHRTLPRDCTVGSRVGAAQFHVSSLVSQSVFPNILPFALKVDPGCFVHFLNSPGLFFSCNNADAITSAFGKSGSSATEKHVDLPWSDMASTNR